MTTLTLDAAELKAATAWVARALPSRPAVPVLSGLQLTTEAGLLRLSAFDYSLHATATVPADGDLPAPVLVQGRMLADVTARLHGQAALTVDGQGVTVTAGRSRFQLRPMISDDYPATPPPAPTEATVDGDEFAAALAAAVAATGREDHGHNLTGVKLTADGIWLTFYATDRYRLVASTTPWDGPDLDVLMPGAALLDAVKGMTGPLRVGSDGERFTAATPTRQFTLLAKAGDYPAVARVMTQPPPVFQAEVGRGSLLDALADARLGVDEKAPVHLTFHGGELTIEAEKRGGEFHAAATIPVVMPDRGEFVFRGNPDFLTDQVKHCPAGTVDLAFTAELKPVTITPADDPGRYTALVMPLKGNQP